MLNLFYVINIQDSCLYVYVFMVHDRDSLKQVPNACIKDVVILKSRPCIFWDKMKHYV